MMDGVDPKIIKQEKVTSLNFLCLSNYQPHLDGKLRQGSGNEMVSEKELCHRRKFIIHDQDMVPRTNRKLRWILQPNNRDTMYLLLVHRCFLFSLPVRVLQAVTFLVAQT